MSIPWDVVGVVIGLVITAASVWFIRVRTTAKLKALGEVDVRVKNGKAFKGRCVDMVKVGARNYLKFDVRENGEACERLVPNDEIVELRATRRTPKSPEEMLIDARAWSATRLRKIEQARRTVVRFPRRKGHSE